MLMFCPSVFTSSSSSPVMSCTVQVTSTPSLTQGSSTAWLSCLKARSRASFSSFLLCTLVTPTPLHWLESKSKDSHYQCRRRPCLAWQCKGSPLLTSHGPSSPLWPPWGSLSERTWPQGAPPLSGSPLSRFCCKLSKMHYFKHQDNSNTAWATLGWEEKSQYNNMISFYLLLKFSDM